MSRCMWFALCDREAEWMTRGPIGDGKWGLLPICDRCADRAEIDGSELYGHEEVQA
jgi:hypothetical protein